MVNSPSSHFLGIYNLPRLPIIYKITFFSDEDNNNDGDEKINDGDEEEDDFLVLGVNDEDKMGMSVDDEEVEEEKETAKRPSDKEKKMTSLKAVKAKKKKHKKHKKHRKKDEVEPDAGPSTSAEEMHEAKRRRRRERLEAQTEKDRLIDDPGDKVILNESSIYSMGNYCSTMLAGLKCQETSCSWSHVMLARDAANQFNKILQFR